MCGRSLTIVTFALAFACLAPRAGWAAGGPYKCRGDASPVYQDRPCDPGREIANLADAPPHVSIVPFAEPPAAPVKPGRAVRPPPREKEKPKPRARPPNDAAERRHVHEGMSEGEVLARLGTPDMQAGKGGRRMRWTYLPVPGDPQTVTVLRFEDGQVKEVERRTLR